MCIRDRRKKVLLASLDVRRPAAQEQLAILAKQAEVDSLPIIAGQMPVSYTHLDVYKRQLLMRGQQIQGF